MWIKKLFTTGRIACGNPCCRPTSRRNFRNVDAIPLSKEDGLVVGPAKTGKFPPNRTNADRRAACHRYLLNLALRIKSDPLTVWRKRWRDGAIGSRKRCGLGSADLSRIKLGLAIWAGSYKYD